MRALRVAVLVLCVAAAARGDDPTPPAPTPAKRTALTVTARGKLDNVLADGEQMITVQSIYVSNPGHDPVELRAIDMFCAAQGGWLTPLESPGRGPWKLVVGAERTFTGPFSFTTAAPATYAVVASRADDGDGMVAVPFGAEGGEAPPAYQPPYPFGVGVAGPVDAIPFADGQRGILLIGQVQCLGGGTPEDVKTRVEIGDSAGALAPVAWEGLGEQVDLSMLWPFVRRIDVPASFQGGLLRLHAEATLGGRPATFDAEWPVTAVQPVELVGPVLGSWQLGNGPGERRLHSNYVNPEARYSYDLVRVEQGHTYRGEPYKNDSYFAWRQWVLAAADGTVRDACDREVDRQPGTTSSPPPGRSAVASCRVNRVVIEHDDGVRTVYFHIRHRSLQPGVMIGERVRAGQRLADIGNNGVSTEPHLHFIAYRVDATGRPRPVPVTFKNAFQDAGGQKPLQGVPVGGSTVQFLERP